MEQTAEQIIPSVARILVSNQKHEKLFPIADNGNDNFSIDTMIICYLSHADYNTHTCRCQLINCLMIMAFDGEWDDELTNQPHATVRFIMNSFNK